MSTELKCPNCGVAGIAGEGGACVCPTCKGTFTFVAGEAKLTDVGELDRIKSSVEKHDTEIEAIKKSLPPGVVPAAPAEKRPDLEVDDDDEDL